MRINKQIIFLFLFSVFGFVNAQTLDDYLKIAAENNPGLKAKYSEFEASIEQVAQANSLPDPMLSFGYFISPVETRVGPQQVKFGLSQQFPWFGTLASKGEMAAFLAESKYQEFLNARNELSYRVKQAWYPLYEVRHIISLQKQIREILSTYKELSLTSFGNGKGSMVDVIRVEIMIENTETEISLLEDSERPLLTNFNKLLNRTDTLPVIIGDMSAVATSQEYYRSDSLLESNPILEAFDLKLQSARAQEQLAKKQGLPKFSLGMDYILVGERRDMVVPDNGKNILMPMVSMSLPIFRNNYKAAIKEAQLRQSALDSYKEEFINDLHSSYELARYEMDKAKQLIELNRSQIEKSNQALSLLLNTYSNSGKDFEEILRLQQDILKYQMAEIKAITHYYLSLAKINYLTAK